jgi:hypothetical protein
MKRFIFSILSVSVFFLGVGALVDNVGAKFKSDEKALDLIRKARVAIGGDSALAGVQSMIIKGRTTQTIKIDGAARSEQGETEIAMQMPDKLMKMVKIGADGDGAGHKIVEKQVDVVVVATTKDGHKAIGRGEGKGTGIGAEPGTRVIVRTDDGTVKEFKGAEAEKVIVRNGDGATSTWTTKDGKTVNVDGKHVMLERTGSAEAHHDALRHNEMLRLTLGLLLTAPQGMDVNYTYGGEGDLDGTASNIVVASFGGQSFKLYLDRSSNLPVGMSFTAPRMPKVMHFNKEVQPPADGTKDMMVFRKVDASKAMAEFTVRFSDYRAVNGVQLPFKWTQTIGGETDEIFEVTGYELNPANIGDKFQNQQIHWKAKKPDGQ